jgi:hypothetical protein
MNRTLFWILRSVTIACICVVFIELLKPAFYGQSTLSDSNIGSIGIAFILLVVVVILEWTAKKVKEHDEKRSFHAS